MTKNSPSKRVVFSGGLAGVAVLVVIVLWVVQSLTGINLGVGEEILKEVEMLEREAAEADWYKLYFTAPEEEITWSGGLDEVLVADIDRARSTIDVAAYDFDLQSVTDALLRAHERGVRVRMVTDSDNADLDQPRDLMDADIPVVEDDRSAIMHNKYVVIDGRVTWTGSWNLTDNGTYRNDNNVIRITSPELSQNYTTEFEEMFTDRAFGPLSPAETPSQTITIQGTLIETYFAPEDEVMDRVMEVVSQAQESIRFMVFSFTDDDLGKLMRDSAKAGVLVEGVFETRGADTDYSEYAAMRRANLNVRLDGNNAIMHHKVIIIDGSTVVLGSFNFTENADESNDENLLVIHNRAIARQFLTEFNRVMALAD